MSKEYKAGFHTNIDADAAPEATPTYRARLHWRDEGMSPVIERLDRGTQEHEYGPHSSGARRLHIGSHPMTETTCDGPQCWCNGGSVPYITTNEELAAYWAGKVKPRDPLLYTQAQVDALVAAERERCARIADSFVRAAVHYRNDPPAETRADDTAIAIAARIREGK